MKRAALPQKPEEYKVANTKEFKPPEGVEFKINDADPQWAQAKAWAHKHGMSQDAFHEAVDLFAGTLVADQQKVTAARNAEIAKLGAAGTARVTAINTFLDAAGTPGLKGRLFTAQDIQDFERLISNRVTQGAAGFSQAHRDPGAQNGRVAPEQFEKMPARERLDYARGFDQKQMPAWHDPRG